jgi:hypothetical protein
MFTSQLGVLSSEFYEGSRLGSFDHAGELEARPFFFLNFKGTPSQEEHITIFSGLRNDDTALSG